MHAMIILGGLQFYFSLHTKLNNDFQIFCAETIVHQLNSKFYILELHFYSIFDENQYLFWANDVTFSHFHKCI